MNVLLAPVAVLGLALLRTRQQVSHNPPGSLSPSSQQVFATLGSRDARSEASSMLQPA